MAYAVADPFRQAIRSGVTVTYTVDVSLGASTVATGLSPTGGQIVDTTRPGVRRTLSLQLAPAPGLFDLLSPIGTTLTVKAHVQYTSRHVVDIPMGVFVVDSERLAEGPGGGLSITAPDRWVLLQRAQFLTPRQSTPGISVSDQIVLLIQSVLGMVVVNQIDTVGAVVGAQTWERETAKSIIDLATDAGLWVYFDRTGVATVANAPAIGASADWLIDASASGVLVDSQRERSRAGTYNVVVLSSSAANGTAAFPTQTVWDNDPNSPTYAGTNPYSAPASAGPFGIVPLFHDTSLPLTLAQAVHTAKTMLYRVTGLASQVSLGSVPNPAMDSADVLDVLPLKERYDIPRVIERHIADTVTTPLTVTGGAQQIEGRSTRTDEWA